MSNHPTPGLTDFFPGRYNVLICWVKLLTWTHSDASASHQNPIAAFFKENHILFMIDPFYLTHRMVGWVESSIDKHQLPQFEEHRKMISNAAASCLSWPHELVRYIYDKPLHLIVFSNRCKNPMEAYEFINESPSKSHEQLQCVADEISFLHD